MRAIALSILLVILSLVCCSLPASAESPQAGETPQTCSDCLVLTPADVEQLKAEFMDIARKAFEAGRRQEKAACLSLV